jgi:hypothetical protein
VSTAGFFGDPAALAKAADVALVFAGNDPTCNRQSVIAGFGLDDSWCETPSDGMENSDRRSLSLQEEQLVKEVHAANPRTILFLMADFPYAVGWSKENVPAILTMRQNAQEAGTVIADVLFGDYSPGGRLVVTWPKSLEQLPPMMDYDLRHGRTYMYFEGEPLFPFGYGLSYTTFAYSGLKASASRMGPDGEITVSVDVKNTGPRAGDEVVQLYVRHEGSKVERPRKELRGFERVSLQPGETKTVRMTLKADSLAYWDEKASRFVVEAEPVRLMVGPPGGPGRAARGGNVVGVQATSSFWRAAMCNVHFARGHQDRLAQDRGLRTAQDRAALSRGVVQRSDPLRSLARGHDHRSRAARALPRRGGPLHRGRARSHGGDEGGRRPGGGQVENALILETTFLIDLEIEAGRGVEGPAQRLLMRHPSHRLHMTPTVAGELAAGASMSDRARWERFVASPRRLRGDPEVAGRYCRVSYRMTQAGGRLPGRRSTSGILTTMP